MYQESNYQESKNIKKLINLIIALILIVTSSTYAYFAFRGTTNTTATQVGCFEVNYSAQDINASELVSTTNYLEGAHTTVSLSKNENCPIYTEASIYVHTNDTTTAPINDVQALKYKVLLEDETIKEGVITTTLLSNDKKLATVELTTDVKNYDIYLWIDSDLSGGAYNQTTYSGYIYAESTQTSTIPNLVTTVMAPAAQSDASIDFSQTSEQSSTNGIYVRSGTEYDEYPIYYYRGVVDNNLIFANFCWKIVRTTETGGLKLIYNGVPTNGTCNNTGDSSQIGISAFNSNSDSPTYVGYMYGITDAVNGVYHFDGDTNEYVFAKNVSYSNGTYTLTGGTISGSWSSVYNQIKDYHYTCFTTGNTCENIKYIYYSDSEQALALDYIVEGKKIENILSEMLDYNTISSEIKGDKDTEGTIDYWYYYNLYENYGGYIEDTVWCNERSIHSLGSWDPNGGSIANLYFDTYNRIINTYVPNLICTRDVDKFTVSNEFGNGALDYPVGLLTADEIMLAGSGRISNSEFYLYSGNNYWTISPGYFKENYYAAYVFSLETLLGRSETNNSMNGIRPSISLAKGYNIISGDGKVDTPYIVDAPPIYSNPIEGGY